MQSALRRRTQIGVDPEDVYVAAEAAGHVAVALGADHRAFDVLVAPGHEQPQFGLDPVAAAPPEAGANDPLSGVALRRLVPEVRSWLDARRPRG